MSAKVSTTYSNMATASLLLSDPRTAQPPAGAWWIMAAGRGIPTTTDKLLYEALEGHAAPETLPFSIDKIDLVISLLFWKRIRKPLIQLPRIACINFHPAPLPEFRGIGGYNVAILEDLPYWGAAVHFVDESFDTGDLIDVRHFDIDASRETAFSLEQKTHRTYSSRCSKTRWRT